MDRIVVELPPLPGQEAGVATCGSVRDRAVLAWRALARAHGLCRNLLAVALLALDRRRMKALLLPGGEGGDDGLAGEELQERSEPHKYPPPPPSHREMLFGESCRWPICR